MTEEALPAQLAEIIDDFASAGVADAADMWNEPEPQPSTMPSFELDDSSSSPAIATLGHSPNMLLNTRERWAVSAKPASIAAVRSNARRWPHPTCCRARQSRVL